jgi:hypothetical protein
MGSLSVVGRARSASKRRSSPANARTRHHEGRSRQA